MSTKLKALSLGLLAVLATAGFAVVNASAEIKGHFESDVDHTTIIGTENGKKPHDLEFKEEGSSASGITCTHAHYDGTTTTKTTQEVTVTPTYTNCGTTSDSTWGNVTVDVNSCGFILYSHGNNTHGTVTVHCKEPGDVIVIHHPQCTITIPEQHPGATLKQGLTYTTTTENGKHTLTADVTVKEITGHFHGGLCIFLGTSHKFEMNGSLTIEGKNTAGEQVNITHTG